MSAPQANIDEIRQAAALGSTEEVHLYLTDYRSASDASAIWWSWRALG